MKNVSIKYDEEIIECTKKIDNNHLHIDISSKKTGKTTLIIEGEENTENEARKIEIKRYIYFIS